MSDTDIIYVKKANDDLEKLTGAQVKEEVLGSISDLTAASALGDTDIVYIKDSNNDLKKLTGSDLKGSISITAKLASSVTITGPVLSNGTQLEILFSSDIAGVDANTGLQINYNNTNYDVKVGKDGSLVAFKAYEVSTGVFKYLQAYTTLDLIFDGTQFVIVGNPVVLSTSDFLVYSNGLYEILKYSTTEQFTGKYWIDGKKIYSAVVDCGALPNTSTKNVLHNIANISQIVKYSGVTSNGSEWLHMPASFNAQSIGLSVNTTTIIVITYSNRSSYTSTYVTLEYTKTTD